MERNLQSGSVNSAGLSATASIASKNQRFGTLILDTIFIYIFSFIVGGFLGLIGLGQALTDTNAYLVGIILFMLYYIPQEGLFGRTLGKLIVGTRVIDETGDTPSFGRIVVRTLCRFIPFEPFSFLRNQPVGWHDSLSKTQVVSTKSR